MIDYELVRSKRKTISIQITETAEVLVKAPRQLPLAEIERFILHKSNWIEQTRRRVLQAEQAKMQFDPLKEGRLLLLGREYPVKYAETTDFDGERFLVKETSFDTAKPALITLYKVLATEIIMARVAYYANAMAVQPNTVKITSAKTRWGSCSGKNGLCFSWRLIFAELSAVDYVVVHELAHIKEHNHSARFWKEVERVLPDYRVRQKHLKLLQQRLNGENWESCPK